MLLAPWLLLAVVVGPLAIGRLPLWRAQPPSCVAFANPSAFDFLDQPDWRQRLEAEVLLPRLRPWWDVDAPPTPRLPILKELEPLQQANLSSIYSLWPRQELKCHLKFFSLVLQTVARLQPELMQPRARPLWRLRPKLPRLGSAAAWRSLPHVAAVVDETLAHLTVMLRRNHTIPALVLSHHLALALGWDWTGEASHLAGLDADPPCWDQAATLATLLDDLVPANESTFAWLVSFGSEGTQVLQAAWHSVLDAFFQGSPEHSRPWSVHGSLQLAAPAGSGAPSAPGIAVQWALPASVFQHQIAAPSQDSPLHVQGPGFAAAGYAWAPFIRADAAVGRVSVGLQPLTAWSAASSQLPQPAAQPPVNVTFAAMHVAGRDWQTSWLCSETNCSQPAALPLWRMLSGQLPGFEQHGELLLRVTVAAPPGGVGRPAAGPQGPISGAALRWGAEASDPQLWGTHGFRSRRLPATSGRVAGRQLEAVRAARFEAAPWLEDWMERYLGELALLAVGAWPPPSAAAQMKVLAAATWLQAAGLVLAVAFSVVMPVALSVWHWLLQRRARQRRLQRIRLQAPHAQPDQPGAPMLPQGAHSAPFSNFASALIAAGSRGLAALRGLLASFSRRRKQAAGSRPATPRSRSKTPPAEQAAKGQRGPSAKRQGRQAGAIKAPGAQPKRQAAQKSAEREAELRKQPAASTPPPAAPVAEPEPRPADSGLGSCQALSNRQPTLQLALELQPAQQQREQGGSSSSSMPRQPAVEPGGASGADAASPDSLPAVAAPPQAADAPGSPPAPAALPEAAAMDELVPAALADAFAATAAAEAAAALAQPGFSAGPAVGAAHAAQATPAALAAPTAQPAAVGREGEGDELAHLCIICWEARRSTVLLPCGHLALCRRCADQLVSKAEPLCPVCRQAVAHAPDVFSP